MARIALYGGSFDPPHRAHRETIRWLLENAPLAISEVWVLPVVAHAFNKNLSPYEDRETLVRAMIEGLFEKAPRSATVSHTEGTLPQTFKGKVKVVRREERYTIDLVENLRREMWEDDSFVLVVGADCLRDHSGWHRWDDLMKLVTLLPIGRGGVDHPGSYAVKMPEISSTQIRQQLAEANLSGLIGKNGALDPAVMKLIEEKGMYSFKEPVFPDPPEVRLVERRLAVAAILPGHGQILTGPFTEIVSVRRDGDDFVFRLVESTEVLKAHRKAMVRVWQMQGDMKSQESGWAENAPQMGVKIFTLKTGDTFRCQLPDAMRPLCDVEDYSFFTFGQGDVSSLFKFFGLNS